VTTRYGIRYVLPDEFDGAVEVIVSTVRELLTTAVESSDRLKWSTFIVHVEPFEPSGEIHHVVVVARIDGE
jgi:hypothetical protein